MNDDELRSALERRVAATPLSADDRNDLIRSARVRATRPPKRSILPRFAGWMAGATAIVVLVLVIAPILLSPPSNSTQPPSTAIAGPSSEPSGSPTSSGLRIYSAQELSNMVGDPDWVGRTVLAQASIGRISSPECPPPAQPCSLGELDGVTGHNAVTVGWRDATSTDGIRYDDGSGYRWIKMLDLPTEAGVLAFTIHQDAAEFLGPARFGEDEGLVEVTNLLGNPGDPSDAVFVVSAWLVQTPPAPCAFPQEGLRSPMPDISSYYCGGSWLTSAPSSSSGSSGLAIDGGLHVQGGAYNDFAPDPQTSGITSEPRQGIYLIRNAGCPLVVTGDCPVWRMVGRLDAEAPTALPSPTASAEPSGIVFDPPVIHVSNLTTLDVQVSLNGVPAGDYAAGTNQTVDPRAFGPGPWHLVAQTVGGRQLLAFDVDQANIWHTTDAEGRELSGVGGRADLSCGRLDIWAGPPMLGPAPPESFPPGDCDVGSPSPTGSPLSSAVPIPIASPWSGSTPQSCPAALVTGRLVADPTWGIALDVGSEVRKVIWPYGYSARTEGDRVALLDETGAVVAYTGDFVSIGGGGLPDGSFNGCGGVHGVQRLGSSPPTPVPTQIAGDVDPMSYWTSFSDFGPYGLTYSSLDDITTQVHAVVVGHFLGVEPGDREKFEVVGHAAEPWHELFAVVAIDDVLKGTPTTKPDGTIDVSGLAVDGMTAVDLPGGEFIIFLLNDAQLRVDMGYTASLLADDVLHYERPNGYQCVLPIADGRISIIQGPKGWQEAFGPFPDPLDGLPVEQVINQVRAAVA